MKILLIIIIIGFFKNIFLYFYTPIIKKPYEYNGFIYEENIEPNDYFSEKIDIEGVLFLPYSSLYLMIDSENIIDIYILNSRNYILFLEFKSQGGTLDDIKYILGQQGRQTE